jgi:hypothetical protein
MTFSEHGNTQSLLQKKQPLNLLYQSRKRERKREGGGDLSLVWQRGLPCDNTCYRTRGPDPSPQHGTFNALREERLGAEGALYYS